MHDSCSADGHHGLTGAHFRIDDCGRFAGIVEQLDHSLYSVALRVEWLAHQAVHNQIPERVRHAVMDGWILAGDRLQQPIAKVFDELRQ